MDIWADRILWLIVSHDLGLKLDVCSIDQIKISKIKKLQRGLSAPGREEWHWRERDIGTFVGWWGVGYMRIFLSNS